MKKIKLLLILPIIAILMSFTQCDRKSFDKKPPVKFTKSYFQDWVGGKPGSSGTLVTLITNSTNNAIVFDSIYFNKRVVKLASQVSGDELILTGNFIKRNPKDRDLILSGNPKEEFGNKPPIKEAKITFELNDNEAIISYFKNNKKRYFKLSDIRKEKVLYYQ